MTARRPTHWTKKALLALASFAIALVLLEAASHLIGRFDPPKDPLQSKYVIAGMGQYDHRLFWTLRPGATDEEGLPWINSDGLRGPEIGAKASDEYRILSLGESTTFARRLDYADCYSARIEARLPELWETQRPVRVINAGVPGYSLFQGYQYMMQAGLALDPDMVLLYFGHNDSLPVSFLNNRASLWRGEQRSMNDRELYRSRQSLPGRVSELLMDHSNAYRGLIQWSSAAGEDVPDAPADQEPPADKPALDAATAAEPDEVFEPRVPAHQRQQLLTLFDQLCRERGIALVIVVPWYRDKDAHAPVLRDFAAANGTPITDLPALLPERLSAPHESYFSDPVHPTSAGHVLITDAILETLNPLNPGSN
ncbi:MAG: lysophospholipase L1-like esterase [Chlamydiales bacterium]|jgi:lysophospholipase L1-like esterase